MSKSPPEDFKITDPEEMKVQAMPLLTKHPGVYLREVILPEWGATKIAPLAAALKVNRPHLVDVLNGRGNVTRELAYRLGARFNDHVADLLISYQHQWDLQQEAARREELKQEIEPVPAPA